MILALFLFHALFPFQDLLPSPCPYPYIFHHNTSVLLPSYTLRPSLCSCFSLVPSPCNTPSLWGSSPSLCTFPCPCQGCGVCTWSCYGASQGYVVILHACNIQDSLLYAFYQQL